MEDPEDNEDVSEDAHILNRPSGARGRASIFSKYSNLSFGTYGQGYQFTFLLISFLTIFITGITIGAITVRFFVCDGDKTVFSTTGNLSYPFPHLYDTI
eukprot:GFUD01140199.1.p1 GENE.GFUD01140199.1~~GFUD01140199.1.p1  ORF type:complete len:110 (-),score=22.56 GFUD01140199.1:38-334(-)